MKLAKKVLAIVMALGLIACMSAMAFAADAGSYSVNYAKSEDGKTLTATVYAHDYVGLTSGSIDVTYSGGAAFNRASTGKAANAVNNTEDNSFTFLPNNTGNGLVKSGFYFKENMWDADTFAGNGIDGEAVDVNVADFDIATFTFDLDGSAYEIKVDIASKSVDGDNSEFTDTKTGPDAEQKPVPDKPEIPTKPVKNDDDKKNDFGKKDNFGKKFDFGKKNDVCKADPKVDCKADPKADCKAKVPCAPKTECAPKTTCKAPVKTDCGKNTGDNGVLAVTAGVIALAAVAFVVTKKRK